MAKRKRFRLKRKAQEILTYIIIFIALVIYATINGLKIYHHYQYQKTDEYKLIELGFSKEQAVQIQSTLTPTDIAEILENDYNPLYYDIINSKYFIPQYYHQYLEYYNYHPKEDIKDIIAIINTHANEGKYEKTIETQSSNDLLVIANNYYHLPDDYERNDLEEINLMYCYGTQKASTIVVNSFIEMYNAALNELGKHLIIISSYRSHKEQEKIYNNYKSISVAYADSYAARPGHSEHETGLALDITSLENSPINDFIKSEEFTWLKNNSYKYGFILRYPEEKEKITGYSNDLWHFRYVGEEVAKQIYDENITFDEYYAYYLENH